MSESNVRVCVAGAGQMGLGIAHAFLSAGFEVSITDINPDALKRASAAIEGLLNEGVARGKMEADGAAKAFRKLTAVTDITEGARGAALLVETVVEKLSVKTDIVRAADDVLAEDAVIATNTSALSVTEIATAAKRPERVIGMHFFNPVHKMKMVELVLGLATDADTLGRARTYCERIGKVSIVVNETPGLTTSRMSAMLGNEAMYMLQEGAASAEDIDTALRLGFNHPMGPLELGDLAGWDTRLSVLRYLHETLGEKFRPCPLIIKMVAAGRIGRKAGAGVYQYSDGQKVPGSGLRASAI